MYLGHTIDPAEAPNMESQRPPTPPGSDGFSSARDRPDLPPTGNFPWGTGECSFLVQTRLPDGRMGIIVDPGAWTNLAGGKWVRELKERAEKHKLKCEQEKLKRPLEVQGVGRGTQSAVWASKMPIAVKNREGTAVEHIFEVPTLEGEDGADIPALLGLRSMRAKDSVLEMGPGKECLTFPGPGKAFTLKCLSIILTDL